MYSTVYKVVEMEEINREIHRICQRSLMYQPYSDMAKKKMEQQILSYLHSLRANMSIHDPISVKCGDDEDNTLLRVRFNLNNNRMGIDLDFEHYAGDLFNLNKSPQVESDEPPVEAEETPDFVSIFESMRNK